MVTGGTFLEQKSKCTAVMLMRGGVVVYKDIITRLDVVC
jgi:hypothetical protein